MALPSSTIAYATTYGGSPNSGSVLKWDGSAWSLMINTGYVNGWSCVYAFSANDVWAIFSTEYTAAIYHWDGITWTHTHEAAYFLSMWGTVPNNLYALGFDGTNQLIYRWDGATWSIVYSQAHGGGRFFELICGKDANAVIAAHYQTGNSDAMYNGAAWASKANTIPADNYLVRGLIYDSADDKYYIAARGGTVIHISSRSTGYAPESWVTIDDIFVANSSRTPRGLYKSGTEWWVLGESGIKHKVGAVWSDAAPGGFRPTSIHGIGADAIWSVGIQDYVGNVALFWNGTAFSSYNVSALGAGAIRDVVVLAATTPVYASASAPGVGEVTALAHQMCSGSGSVAGLGDVTALSTRALLGFTEQPGYGAALGTCTLQTQKHGYASSVGAGVTDAVGTRTFHECITCKIRSCLSASIAVEQCASVELVVKDPVSATVHVVGD
jgi:hypothetical protein